MGLSLFHRLVFLFTAFALARAAPNLPAKIYGVNFGSWLVLEPWMLPQGWLDMGGEQCSDCSKCIASEFAFAQAYPKTVDATFDKHWKTWFNQTDINQLLGAGINTVRIPLGYWIVEPLVDRKTEFYPRGGIVQLQRGLKQLKNAGITVILDHHALPGVHSAGQMFAGRCTSDVQFYTPYNYRRALIWSAVMTALIHLDPAFSTVASLQAVNEPTMDANKTPGYGQFQKHFVQVVRAVEAALGIRSSGANAGAAAAALSAPNITSSMIAAASEAGSIFSPEIGQVLREAVPILVKVALQLAVNTDFTKQGLRSSLAKRNPITTSFQDVTWQYNSPSNPADAKWGPQSYDNHLYYSFGGVADANEEAYLRHICNLDRIEKAAALGNTPLWFGEWALSTQFPASDEFLRKWADAQKLAYSKGAGWIFWSFKIETSERSRQWSYLEGLRRGYFTKDPSKYNNPRVCDPYIKKAA